MKLKKRLSLTVAMALCVLLVLMTTACGDKQSDASGDPTSPTAPAGTAADSTAEETDAAEPAESGIAMTDSYRAGRQAYYDITGIWMPEVEGFEAEYDANYEHKSIAFDSHGDRALFEGAKAALAEALGEPDNSDEISAYWARHNEDDTAVLNYEVYYHETESDGIWVYMNFFTQAIDG